MSDWISVKRKLPDLDQVVLVRLSCDWDNSHRFDFGARIDDGEGWVWGIKQDAISIHPAKDASWNGIDADDDHNVTHWMSLPKPPRVRRAATPTKQVPA